MIFVKKSFKGSSPEIFPLSFLRFFRNYCVPSHDFQIRMVFSQADWFQVNASEVT